MLLGSISVLAFGATVSLPTHILHGTEYHELKHNLNYGTFKNKLNEIILVPLCGEFTTKNIVDAHKQIVDAMIKEYNPKEIFIYVIKSKGKYGICGYHQELKFIG